MFIKFKGTETAITATSVIEQKLYKQGEAIAWMLSLNLSGNFTAQYIDELLGEEGISEITLVGEKEKTSVILGYEKVTSCVVRYSEDKSVAEIQLLKNIYQKEQEG